MANTQGDVTEITRALAVLLPPGQVTELRALNASTPNWRNPHTVSGYFDRADALAQAAAQLTQTASGVYVVVNPVEPSLLARAANRVRDVGKSDPLTSDTDIPRRRWLLMDTDPDRPAGISANDAEHAAALARAQEIRDWLTARGWPAPVSADSGNGGHLLYATDLPNDAGSATLLQQVLEALDVVFTGEGVKIDTTVFNASRIWKLYGTWARKGDSTPDRPHRLSRLLDVPATIETVSIEQLQALAAMRPEAPTAAPPRSGSPGQSWDLARWVSDHRLDVLDPVPYKVTGQKWLFRVCPFNADHTDRSAVLIEWPSGAAYFRCHHNGCSGKTWRDLRALYEPDRGAPRGVAEGQGTPSAPVNDPPQLQTQTQTQTQDKPQDKPQPPGHDVLQDRYLSLYPNTVYSLSSWWRYNGQVWRVIDDGLVDREIRGVLQAAKSEGVRITGQLLSSVRVLARSATYTPGDAWDTDPDLLTCQNGVLRISTGELLDHGPHFYATSAVSYAYDPDAEAPVWRYFLGMLTPEVESFLQEWAGYSLTTDTSHELAVWLYGPPGGGKSTYLAGLLAMLGKRAGRLSLRDIEQSRFALADLPGKTLVIATEQPSHYVAATDVLNSIISGEPVAAERKFRDAITITPRAKICWAMNVLPRVDADDGLFRRVRVVKFDAIPEEDRDPQVKENIAQEGAGILNWALVGLRRLRERGRFAVPAAVAEVTRQFKEHNDLPAQFVADRCEVGAALEVKGSELYLAYRGWCEGNGYRPLAANNAAREWERLGFTSKRTNASVIWYGLKVV